MHPSCVCVRTPYLVFVRTHVCLYVCDLFVCVCSLSILLTYVFSKSPLFVTLIRFLRTCMGNLSQVRAWS